MKFSDRLDIAVARGLIVVKDGVLFIPREHAPCNLFPSLRNITPGSLARAMRRAGYVRATQDSSSWRRREDSERSGRCHQ